MRVRITFGSVGTALGVLVMSLLLGLPGTAVAQSTFYLHKEVSSLSSASTHCSDGRHTAMTSRAT